MITQRPRDAQLAPDTPVSNHAALLRDAGSLGGVRGTVVVRDAPDAPPPQDDGPRVPDVGDVEGRRRALPVDERHGGGAAALPRAQHGELAIDLLERGLERAAYIPARGQALKLCQHHLMQGGLAIVDLLPATVAVVDRVKAPLLPLAGAGHHERVDDLVPVLHVGSALLVGVRGEAHEGHGATAPRGARAPRRPREGRHRPLALLHGYERRRRLGERPVLHGRAQGALRGVGVQRPPPDADCRAHGPQAWQRQLPAETQVAAARRGPQVQRPARRRPRIPRQPRGVALGEDVLGMAIAPAEYPPAECLVVDPALGVCVDGPEEVVDVRVGQHRRIVEGPQDAGELEAAEHPVAPAVESLEDVSHCSNAVTLRCRTVSRHGVNLRAPV
mmetsp:Transcript_114644/g.324728  ORF Transcript_114644/g.324728 Transcript_114644/m.324728 type:complete len:388 (-) Transcript_114644:38-1201(-)